MGFDPSLTGKRALLQDAYRAYLAEEAQTALGKIKPLIAETPDDPDLWCALVRPHLALGEIDLADLALEQALQLAPESPEPLVMQAWIFLSFGEVGDALEACEEAKEYATKRSQKQAIRFCEASLLYALFQEKLEEILEGYRDAGSDIPAKMSCPPALEKIRTKALDLLDMILEKDPEEAASLVLKARILSEANRLEEAVQTRSHALAILPGVRTWLHEQGQDLEAMGEFLQAQGTYKRLYTEESDRIRASPHEELEWEKEDFLEAVRDVWTDLEATLQEDGATFTLTWEVSTFPDQRLLSDLDSDEAFDPWSPVLIDVRRDLLDRMVIHLHIFQRNVERIALRSDPPDLDETLDDLLEKELLPIFAYEDSSGEE